MIRDAQSAQISQKQDECNLYAIMKTVRPPGYHHYHHNCFLATHALGHIMYGYKIYIPVNFSDVIPKITKSPTKWSKWSKLEAYVSFSLVHFCAILNTKNAFE